MALVRYEALLLGFCLLRVASGSQTVDDHGREKNKKNKNGLRQISDFYRKQTNKKSPRLFCFITALYTTEI